MHLALRPYITTGVAIVGASVVAVAPLAIPPSPPDIQVANPAAAVERGVQLTANEIQTAVNTLIFNFVASPTAASAELLGRLLTPLIGEEQAFLLPIAALGLTGPLISGAGAGGTALQHLVDSDDFAGLINNLIGAPATLLDGLVNGAYGPSLTPLVADQVAALLSAQFHSPIRPEAIGTVLAGGILGPGELLTFAPLFKFNLPGANTTLQGLVDQLFGLLGGSDVESARLSMATAPRNIEDANNNLILGLTTAAVQVTHLLDPILVPLVEPLLPASIPEPLREAAAKSFITGALLGLAGPLISGPGAGGTALQNLVDSLGSGDPAGIVKALIGAPATVLDGVVNGQYGPNLVTVVTGLPADDIPPGTPPILAGGLINPGGLIFKPPSPIPTGVALPGTIPTLQLAVSAILGALNPAATTMTITGRQTQTPLAGGDEKITLTEKPGDTVLDGKVSADTKKVTPKKNRPLQSILRVNPLDQSAKKDAADSASGTTSKHLPGLGKTPVANLVKRILGGSDDKENGAVDKVSEKTDTDPK